MQREKFIIGSNEYQASKIPAFEANEIIMKLQKLILPVIGEISAVAKGQDLAEVDAQAAMRIISEKIDKSVMDDIVMPMFKLSRVACTSADKAFELNSSVAFNQAFGDADGLPEMYELIFEVLRFNFGSFFTKLMDRFGAPAGGNQKATG